MSDLRRLAEAARSYEAPWELAGSDLPDAAHEWWMATTPDVILRLLDERDAFREAAAVMQASEAELRHRAEQAESAVERLRGVEVAARAREKAEEVYADAEEAYNTSSRPTFTRKFLQIDRLATERAEAVLALRAALTDIEKTPCQ